VVRRVWLCHLQLARTRRNNKICLRAKRSQNKLIINNMDLLDYIDWNGICEDYDLSYGDLSPDQVIKLETILKEFIKQNK